MENVPAKKRKAKRRQTCREGLRESPSGLEHPGKTSGASTLHFVTFKPTAPEMSLTLCLSADLCLFHPSTTKGWPAGEVQVRGRSWWDRRRPQSLQHQVCAAHSTHRAFPTYSDHPLPQSIYLFPLLHSHEAATNLCRTARLTRRGNADRTWNPQRFRMRCMS